MIRNPQWAPVGITFLLTLMGCKATPPNRLESFTVNTVKHHIMVGNKSQLNPLPATEQNIATGKEAFLHYCVACHGMDGQNTGVPFADRMSPPPPPLSSPHVQSYTDGQLKWIIDNGLRPTGMPGSSGILSDDEIWSTVLYIRHLPPKGSVGEPDMYQH
jgi:mono/diheme cytochrome c family protein